MNPVLKTALKPMVLSEHVEQSFLIQRLALLEGRYPELGLIFAVPNGGLRSKATAGKLKAEGVKPAVPDLVLPVARYPFHGLFVEMKREGEYARPDQRAYQARLIEQDFAVVTCQGYAAAFDLIIKYLGLQKWTTGERLAPLELDWLTENAPGVFTYHPPTTTRKE